MSIPTTPFKLPLQGKPVQPDGSWTPAWFNAMQYLFTRTGADNAPSNLQLAEAIANNIVGPSVSIDNDVVVFDGTTGKIVRDSGVLITALAKLDSPEFVNIPTAPTPAPGTNTDQLATTAFVYPTSQALAALTARAVPLALVDAATITSDAAAHNSFYVTLGGNRTLGAPSNLADGMLLNYIIKQDATGGRTLAFNAIFDFGAAGTPTLSTAANAVDYVSGYYDATANKILASIRKAQSTASYFSAHNSSVNQSIPNNALTALSFSTTAYNVGSNFAASAWTPPAGRPVTMSGSCAITLTGSGLMILSIFKNGVEFKRGPQANFSGYVAQDQTMNVTAMDVPNGTDVYTLRVAQTTGSAMSTNGLPILVWFQGTTLQA